MKCLGCKAKDTFWCDSCQTLYESTLRELATTMGYLGEHYNEGALVLSAHELMESERLLGTTPLGKAAFLRRAHDLLLEVEDHFIYTPMCPLCKKHKMELKVGEPLVAGCTAGCEL